MSNQGQGLLSHFYIGFVCFMLINTRARYLVSIYRTIGPLVLTSALEHRFLEPVGTVSVR